MKLETKPFPPIVLGVPVGHYKEILKGYQYIQASVFPRLFGEVEIDGELRQMKFSVKDGIVTAAELLDIKKGDTFCGVSMQRRLKVFQKDLVKVGMESTVDYDILDLVDFPVSFYFEAGKVASINWELPE